MLRKYPLVCALCLLLPGVVLRGGKLLSQARSLRQGTRVKTGSNNGTTLLEVVVRMVKVAVVVGTYKWMKRTTEAWEVKAYCGLCNY